VSSGVLSDARERAGDQQVETDIRIVGAGPAGISAARELIGNGARVGLLGRSGKDTARRAERLNRGQSVGHPTLTVVALALRVGDLLKTQLVG
jgi:predicted NAD/FAD-dependent oxidoreductase